MDGESASDIDWARIDLPNAWPDELNFARPSDLLLFLRHICGFDRSKVTLPDGLPGHGNIPKYVLQEFHNLPNGNYSKRVTCGYVKGFDRAMLGHMGQVRAVLADWMADCTSVLDAGCAGGRLAASLKRAGVEDVWGLDPSPYLLQLAAREFPGITFTQGIAENTGLESERFDGVAVCFLFHEMPPKYFEQSLAEFSRILKADGLLAICEPSALHLKQSVPAIWKDWGLRGLYFKLLARFAFEPFLTAWHRQDVSAQLANFGFETLVDHDEVPTRRILARKIN